jgi:hypothetical protein
MRLIGRVWAGRVLAGNEEKSSHGDTGQAGRRRTQRTASLPMSQFFRRSRPDAAAAATSASAPVASTEVWCTLTGCTNETAAPCVYQDGRGRACDAQYCPEHGETINGKFYCRRHAGIVRAVGAGAEPNGGLPDLDNRAPSLVNWIARDLDANVRRLLGAAAGRGESVLADETVRVVRDFNRKARWEQSWRLVDHTGLILKVTIQVLEEHDSLVRVHVGSGVIADGVPPWIVRRSEEHDMASDAEQRQRFYQWLDESIFLAVERFRTERTR